MMASRTGSMSPAARLTASNAWPAAARDPVTPSPLPLGDGCFHPACRAMPARSRGEAS